MELANGLTATSSEVNSLASYWNGQWFVHNPDGHWLRTVRHGARVRLMRRLGCTRPEAEQMLDQLIDWSIAHPAEALEIKRREHRTFVNIQTEPTPGE